MAQIRKSASLALDTIQKQKWDRPAEPELLEKLAELTQRTGVEVILQQDLSATVLEASFGESQSARSSVPKKLIRHKGVRPFISLHTHPNGSSHLSEADLTAASQQCPVLLACIGVQEGKITGVSYTIPKLEDDEIVYDKGIRIDYDELQDFPFRAIRSEINKELDLERFTEDESEQVILIGLDLPGQVNAFERSMTELSQLAQTAGAYVLGEITQARSTPDGAFYLGKGKLEELSLLIQKTGADCIIANDTLSPVQIRNIEAYTGLKVIDRTQLILDIFALHAASAEGRLQVELAQQQYRLSRIRGLGQVLSRTGGGIGTRGPGEKKLEVDRRKIERQIYELGERLKRLERSREITGKERKNSDKKIVSLVGYTNAGKSTLFNVLTGAEVVEKNALFVTLDSTVRRSSDESILFSDTVGFIDKLPHELVRAFRSTLMEAREADLLLHVIDASDLAYEAQCQIVEKVLREIGCPPQQQILRIYNKIDCLSEEQRVQLEAKAQREGALLVSAKERFGIETLLETISEKLSGRRIEATFLIPYDKGALLSKLHTCGEITESSYLPEGTRITLQVREEDLPSEAQRYKV